MIMKLKLFFLFSLFALFGKTQNDTLLYNDFSFQAYNADTINEDSIVFYFDLLQTNSANIQYQGWETLPNQGDVSDVITTGVENYIWYNDDLWKDWHIIPYTDSIDTIVGIDTVTYDTISNFGVRSFSWFKTPARAQTVLLTPAVFLKDNSGVLSWRSMPLQGPRHQDGYKVFILPGGNNDLETTPFLTLEYDFAMKELDVSNSSPLKTITSLVELQENFGFVPFDGTDHIEYTLPDTNGEGNIDSTRQQPFMQEFQLSLSAYSGVSVQIAFVHDSYDNNGIVLDDILIMGTGVMSASEIVQNWLNVYPNPTTNKLFIEHAENWDTSKVEIFDFKGSLVLTTELNNNSSVDVSMLEAGQYFLKLHVADGVYTQSFIKAK